MVTTSNKRKERDLMKLMMSNYEVSMVDEKNQYDFHVVFKGPKESSYEGVSVTINFQGVWKVHVLLPDNYPYKSPSIGFANRIFHPNVDEA
jgi:ubiquitin-conjugating enzyme E2 H